MQSLDKRKVGLIAGGALVVALAWQTPTASLEIQTHDVTDVAPKKMEAALDLGIAAFSLLITWTQR
jgi:hypothetical protein